MYKAQFKKHSPYESWTTFGTYGSEAQAVSAALQKKKMGVIMIRVVDKKGSTIYSGQFMIDKIQYYILQLIDWKIKILNKTRMYVSGEYKYILSDKKLEKEINRWRHTR